jgi:hypothetical protein
MAYTEENKEEIFNKIIAEIADEGTPVRTILKRKGMPSSSTFFIWLDEDDFKSKQYARACEMRAEVLFDQMLQIAFTPVEGETKKIVKKGKVQETETTKGDMLGHRRLQVDTIKWSISKLAPKKYGDKMDVTTAGDKINGTPSIVRVEVVNPDFDD